MAGEQDPDLEVLLAALKKVKAGDAPPPNYDDPQAALRVAVELAIASMRRKQEEAPVQGLKMNWEVPVIPMLTLVLALGSGVWYGSDKIARQDAAIAAVKQQADLSTSRGNVYGPRVDLLSESNKVQDERISRLADSIIEIRKGSAEQMSVLWTMRNDLTTIMAQTNMRKPQ